MAEPVVVLAGSAIPFAEARALLERHATLAGEERLGDAAALYFGPARPVRADPAYLARAPRLRVVSTAAVGYDNIDVAELTRRGIPFSNARGSLTEAVADVAYLLVLAAMRRLAFNLRWVSDGSWAANGDPPHADDLAEATLGIVGMGEIGCALARRARTSGMRIVYCNRTPRAEETALEARRLDLETLLRAADCVVALTPLTPQTRGMFGAAQFALMKPTAFFVNVARGKVVDTEALRAALAEGRIAGAALDVTDPEPLPPDHPLLALPNVFVTPHVGSLTQQTRARMSLYAAQNIVAGLEGRRLPQIVNPEVYDLAGGSSRT